MIMLEIVVYLKEDYSKSQRIWVSGNLDKDAITKIVDSKFDEWFFYDII